MRRRKVWSKFSFALLLGVIAGILLDPGVAQADTWTDISDSQWQSSYGVTAAQINGVADGFLDGTFRPTALVTRG